MMEPEIPGNKYFWKVVLLFTLLLERRGNPVPLLYKDDLKGQDKVKKKQEGNLRAACGWSLYKTRNLYSATKVQMVLNALMMQFIGLFFNFQNRMV